MAAVTQSKATPDSLGFRRLWAALGASDDAAGRPVVEHAPDHGGSSPSDEGLIFRRLDAGTEDLLDPQAVSDGSGAVAAVGAARTSGAVLKRFAGVTAWVVAAAAGMTVLFPPRDADAYHYWGHGGHFDHAKKEQIAMVLDDWDDVDPTVYHAWNFAAGSWTRWSDVVIQASMYSSANSAMAMRATWWWDPYDSRQGWADLWDPGDRSHWVHRPASIVWINMAQIQKKPTELQQNHANATASHEVGHALGLAHTPDMIASTPDGQDPCDSSKWNYGIMQAGGTSKVYRKCGWMEPQQDDTNGVNNLYLASSK